MSLQEEIEQQSRQIYRDAYQMSVGELINLYKDGEIDIHPRFQRMFRWSTSQKTRLIESILLNIPIPPIFVSQRGDGIWDVIDGVQRLSTIFQFCGCLQDEQKKIVDPFILEGTLYLPSLQGKQWDNEVTEDAFTSEQKLFFKRARMDVVIVKKDSNSQAKYDLFQRLNTGGSALTSQEVRNCMIIMENPDFYDFLVELSQNPDFINCTQISDRKSDEGYRQELVLRLIIAERYVKYSDNRKYSDLSDLLDKETLFFCQELTREVRDDMNNRFSKTFQLLINKIGPGVFRKTQGNRSYGPFMTPMFQCIATGVFANIKEILKKITDKENKWLQSRIRKCLSSSEYEEATKRGATLLPRYINLSKHGIQVFKPWT